MESCYLLHVYTLRHSLTLSSGPRRHSRGGFHVWCIHDARLGKRGPGIATFATVAGRNRRFFFLRSEPVSYITTVYAYPFFVVYIYHGVEKKCPDHGRPLPSMANALSIVPASTSISKGGHSKLFLITDIPISSPLLMPGKGEEPSMVSNSLWVCKEDIASLAS